MSISDREIAVIVTLCCIGAVAIALGAVGGIWFAWEHLRFEP
jgi:hypothetical protein